MRLLICFLILLSCDAIAQQRPNIIFIMSDDHDSDAISAYNKKLISTPNIDRIAKEGMLFKRAFVGNSICGPSRATLLTGQHSHKNGVIDNRSRLDPSKITMPKLLQQAGYQTAVIGKWHLHTYPTGFNYWKILPGQGFYFQPKFINMAGDTVTQKGYASDVITDEAINWLDTINKAKPFALLLHHKAPHRNFFPPLKYIREYQNKTFPEPATLYADTVGKGSAWRMQTMSILPDMMLSSDLKVDPFYLKDIPALKPDSAEVAYYHAIMNRIPEPDRTAIKEIYSERGKLIQRLKLTGKELLKYKYQWYMQDYLASVASVDENIGRVLDHLKQTGTDKNTMIVYTSDQDFFLGENGWFDKRFMYDVSMHTPLIIKWPGVIKPGTTSNEMVQNIDFAPTLLDAASLKTPQWMHGKSIKPLLLNAKAKIARPYLYYHFYEYNADHTVLPHVGIRGNRYKLIYFYSVNEWELYDLKNDPREQTNLAHSTRYVTILSRMKHELIKIRKEYDDREPAGVLK
ncbi:MAG TPA: sulfatase [Sphingobacteriaceae bacterium]|nr:sulfatase [Sphingobacteriaceae bacterium]